MNRLTGTEILLRALEPEDLDVLYKWENDTENWLVSGTVTPFSKDVLQEYISSSHHDIYTNKQLRLMIEKVEDEECIGCIDLFDFDPKNKRAGVGILIGEYEERSKGYASEALGVLIDYSFNILDLHQIYCNIAYDNNKSLNLFKNHGFEVCGLKNDWIFDNGRWLDEYILQLIREK